MLENNLLWVDTLPARHTGWHCHPHSSGEQPCPFCFVGFWSRLWNLGGSRLALLDLCTLGLWWEWYPRWSLNHLQDHSSFSWEIKHVFSQIALLSCPIPFGPNWQCRWSFDPNYSWLLLRWLKLWVISLKSNYRATPLVFSPEVSSICTIWVS